MLDRKLFLAMGFGTLLGVLAINSVSTIRHYDSTACRPYSPASSSAPAALANEASAAGMHCMLAQVPPAERTDRWLPDATADTELAKKLREVAPTGEVLIAVSDHNLAWDPPGKHADKACAPNCNPGMLQTFIKGVKRAGVTNYLIVVPQLQPEDKDMLAFLDSQGVPNFPVNVQVPNSQKASTRLARSVSALKYTILLEFMRLGYAVLLSDVDIVTLQNPFDFLHRDSDVEGMTDGYDPRTGYGHIVNVDEPSMGWARYASSIQHFALNSGLFYLRPNNRTVDLLKRIATRVSREEKAWDQSVYNQEIFFLSHGNYKSPQACNWCMCVSVRVMDITRFTNSRVMFKTLRYQEHTTPVMVHMNYHPDKHERMKGVWRRYIDGDAHALDSFPDGSS
eukprot:jgi/Chlat1/2029/Chrsp159S02332